MIFADRRDAAQQLTKLLEQYKDNNDAIVIGLPRGGVVVAAVIAETLNLPLDVVCPRKLGAPYQPELAMGAVTETGDAIFNEEVLAALSVPPSYLENIIQKEKLVAQQRARLYRKERPPLSLENKIAILVDDGLATGATMKAAIASVKALGASKIVVAIPVSPIDTLEEIQSRVDEIHCLQTPTPFYAVGVFYHDFSQTEDEEVIDLLKKAKPS